MTKRSGRFTVLVGCAAVLLPALAGCSTGTEKSENANPQSVYQIYQVSYDGGSGETTAYARFRFGGWTGTNLRLTGKSRVVHNHCELREGSFFGAHYQGSTAGFRADHRFEYTDTEGRTSVNTLTLAPADFPPDAADRISRRNPLRVAFVGPPAREEESVVFTLEQQNPPVTLLARARAGACEAALSAIELAQLGEGPARGFWQRQSSTKPQQGTPAGGEMSATYKTAVRTFTIVP